MDSGSQFMELHRSGTFVMVNVADAGTARAVCEAGAPAIATTSGGRLARQRVPLRTYLAQNPEP